MNDCCQGLSVPPTLKYESEVGPGITAILNFRKGSDTPSNDQAIFLAAQILFRIIGMTNGHATNLSLFLSSGGGFQPTPRYDILTAQPSLDQILLRHFRHTAADIKLPDSVVIAAVMLIAERRELAFRCVTNSSRLTLPRRSMPA